MTMSPAGPPPPPRVAGLGTIVGSAVFNVLFVIAACAFACPNLSVTWWPLARDCVSYCIGIIALVAMVIDFQVMW